MRLLELEIGLRQKLKHQSLSQNVISTSSLEMKLLSITTLNQIMKPITIRPQPQPQPRILILILIIIITIP